jgi:hypothetical protein
MVKEMYHTQEKWDRVLTKPVISNDPEAWLGVASYFWYDLDDAHYWGLTMKNQKGEFEVYNATITTDNLLDTVFNETHYLFWLKNIEAAVKRFAKMGVEANLTIVNEYFRDKEKWTKFDGIMFQDVSTNEDRLPINKFYYRKRIQVGVYNQDIISNFALRYSCMCSKKRGGKW